MGWGKFFIIETKDNQETKNNIEKDSINNISKEKLENFHISKEKNRTHFIPIKKLKNNEIIIEKKKNDKNRRMKNNIRKEKFKYNNTKKKNLKEIKYKTKKNKYIKKERTKKNKYSEFGKDYVDDYDYGDTITYEDGDEETYIAGDDDYRNDIYTDDYTGYTEDYSADFASGEWEYGHCLAADGKSRPATSSIHTLQDKSGTKDSLAECRLICEAHSDATGCEHVSKDPYTCSVHTTPLSKATGEFPGVKRCLIFVHSEVHKEGAKGVCIDRNGHDIVEGQSLLKTVENFRTCVELCLDQHEGFGCEFHKTTTECFIHTTQIEGANGFESSICWNFEAEHIGPIEDSCGDYQKFKCDDKTKPGECIPVNKLCNEKKECPEGNDEDKFYCEAPLAVRLRPEGRNGGLLEVRYNGVWGTMCKNNIDQVEADIFCKMLGYSAGAKKGNRGYFTESKILHPAHDGTWPSWQNRRTHNPKDCVSSMESIKECSNMNFWSYEPHCNHEEDIYLFCHGEKKGIDTNRDNPACEPEDTAWKHFKCDKLKGGRVDCIPIDKLCDGEKQCEDGSDEASSRCDSDIAARLRPLTHPLVTGGFHLERAGLLEIRFNGVWGTVSHGKSFTDREADVFCRMLGYIGGEYGVDGVDPVIRADSSKHKPVMGPWPVWIRDKGFEKGKCTGKEYTIVTCHNPDSWQLGSDNNHNNDVYLACSHTRLNGCEYDYWAGNGGIAACHGAGKSG